MYGMTLLLFIPVLVHNNNNYTYTIAIFVIYNIKFTIILYTMSYIFITMNKILTALFKYINLYDHFWSNV